VSTPERDVLLVGAFERDNFGDSLFLLATERLLGPRCLAASVVSSDMTEVLGRRVVSYDSALTLAPWRLVWVVGGEIGGVTVADALPMSLPDGLGDDYEALSPDDRSRYDSYVSGLDDGAPAYLPELDRYPLNDRTPLVVASVGLTGGLVDGGSVLGTREAAALGRATVVSVREHESERVATALGVPTRLSPDLVHALPLLFPETFPEGAGRPAERTETRRGSLVFQMNRGMLDEAGTSALALELAEAAREQEAGVLLFPAGTARHHDSPEQYVALREEMRAVAPDVEVQIVETRGPLELARVIGDAVCWVGSSLHGRIVSSALGVPRVSLQVDKVTRYAATWPDGMPSDVPVDGIVVAVRAAVAAAASDEQLLVDRGLTERALANARAITDEVLRDVL